MATASIATVKPRMRGVSHELAFFAALGAGTVLVALAPPRAALAAAIYALSLATMLGVSALYHRPTWAPQPRRWMRRLDHAAIFVLVAGTYTPFTLLLPRHGHAMLALAWTGAALGIAQSLFWVHAPRPLVAALYLLLGWAVVIFWPALHAALGAAGLAFLVLGGVLYSIGAIIYAARRPDPAPQVFGYHEIFHALVVLAAVCHFGVVVGVVRALR
ncbi:MAG TPA: hemolysin III family protein [Myxococcales bacterium]|nr:hemolysin III family protein [Myxococcales bacterium]